MNAYLDHAAAAVSRPAVREAMAEALEVVGSPSSVHEWSRGPQEILDRAREQVASLLGAEPRQIIFTSGASESRNLAIKGLASANRRLGDDLVISAVEHPATVAAARTITRESGSLTEVKVDGEGHIPARGVEEAIGGSTSVASFVLGQGDIGTLNDPTALVAAAKAARGDVRVHIDAGDCVGRVPIDVASVGCDAITLGGWPLGAPPWAGALWLAEGARMHPLIEGGVQELGKRSGSEALPAIAALGAAAAAATAEGEQRHRRLAALSERLIAGIEGIDDVRLNGPRQTRVPGHVQVSVGTVEAETLVLGLSVRGVAASPGSACTAYAGKAAPALEAIGLEAPWTQSAVLFTMGDATTEAEIDFAITAFTEALAQFRAASPLGR